MYKFLLKLMAFFLVGTAFAQQLHEGDRAPLFVLEDAEGKVFSLAEALKVNRYVIVVFYPQDNSPICTKQACRIRDSYDRVPSDVAIVGISNDTAESHKSFIEAYRIPYRLLIDKDNVVRKAYGAYRWGFIPDRVTCVIDKSGHIVGKYEGIFSLDQHMALIENRMKEQL